MLLHATIDQARRASVAGGSSIGGLPFEGPSVGGLLFGGFFYSREGGRGGIRTSKGLLETLIP